MSQSTRNLGFVLTALVTISLAALPCAAVVIDAISNGDMELGGTDTTPPTDWDDGNDGVVGVSPDTPDGSAQSMLVLNDTGSNYYGLARQDATVDPRAHAVQLAFSYKGGVSGDAVRWELQPETGPSLGAVHLPVSGCPRTTLERRNGTCPCSWTGARFTSIHHGKWPHRQHGPRSWQSCRCDRRQKCPSSFSVESYSHGRR